MLFILVPISLMLFSGFSRFLEVSLFFVLFFFIFVFLFCTFWVVSSLFCRKMHKFYASIKVFVAKTLHLSCRRRKGFTMMRFKRHSLSPSTTRYHPHQNFTLQPFTPRHPVGASLKWACQALNIWDAYQRVAASYWSILWVSQSFRLTLTRYCPTPLGTLTNVTWRVSHLVSYHPRTPLPPSRRWSLWGTRIAAMHYH